MTMTYTRPFRAGPVEPVVEVGHNLLLANARNYKLYHVAYIEPIPRSHPLVVNIGAILAGATAPDFNPAAVLDFNYGQLGQLRAAVIDDIHVTMLQPAGQARFGNMNVFATINAFSALYDPCAHETEQFIFEQDRMFLRAVNPTGYALVQARIAFWGYRYVLAGDKGPSSSGEHTPPLKTFLTIDDALASGEKFTVIPVGGWSR